jgi:hypothetical protein
VCFAGDLSQQEQKVVWATHYAPATDLFSQNARGTAWKSEPTWFIVANNDGTVHADLQRFAVIALTSVRMLREGRMQEGRARVMA